MSLPVYQNMVNLITGFHIFKRPSIFVHVGMWEHHILDREIVGCGRVCYSNTIIITDFCKLSFPICQSKDVFTAYFGLEIS
jgi:hypothetical protein